MIICQKVIGSGPQIGSESTIEPPVLCKKITGIGPEIGSEEVSGTEPLTVDSTTITVDSTTISADATIN